MAQASLKPTLATPLVDRPPLPCLMADLPLFWRNNTLLSSFYQISICNRVKKIELEPRVAYLLLHVDLLPEIEKRDEENWCHVPVDYTLEMHLKSKNIWWRIVEKAKSLYRFYQITQDFLKIFKSSCLFRPNAQRVTFSGSIENILQTCLTLIPLICSAAT